METVKKLIRKKRTWIGIVILFSINQVVNANKEANSDLLSEYYDAEPASAADTTKAAITEDLLSKADSLIIYSKTLLGKGYVYGKIGPDAFDCSGFIYHVFGRFNISLPHSSKAQSRLGDAIDRSEIQEGDLLFFKSPSPNNPNVGHVGIAIENNEGKIKFIHSSTGRGVVIDSLESKHYGRRFIHARRFIN